MEGITKSKIPEKMLISSSKRIRQIRDSFAKNALREKKKAS